MEEEKPQNNLIYLLLQIQDESNPDIEVPPKKFAVDKEFICKYSKIIKNQIDDLTMDNDEHKIFPISKFTEDQITWFLEYINHHGLNNAPAPIPKPLPSKDLQLYISKWDYEFITKFDEIQLVDLLQVANFFDCNELLELGYALVVSIFIGNTLDELKQQYDIKEDLTYEVEQQIKKEHQVNIFKGTAFEKFTEKELQMQKQMSSQQQQQLAQSQQQQSMQRQGSNPNLPQQQQQGPRK